jgi:phospholipid-binding lipoprotein MlaA
VNVRRALAASALAALVAGCAGAPSKVDPFEPMNRAMYQVHDALDTAVAKPVAEGYQAVVPQFVRTMVANVFNNVDDLFSAVNGLLQGKLDKAGNDLGRVLTNTFFGFGGLIDVATDAGIERGNEDFGQTFAVWGFPQGPYLFIPLFGPTTVRDGTGVLVRIALGPVGYVPDVPLRNSLYGLGYVDLRAQALEAGSIVDTAALDRYLFIRNAYLQRRRYLVYDGKPPPEAEDE